MLLPETPLLALGDRRFTAAHVVGGAALRGDLAPVWAELCRRQAAVEQVSDQQLQDALNDFRKDRGLTAADDFRAWLAARSLSLDDVADHLERGICAPGQAAADAAEALYVELVCSGSLDRWMLALGRRLAVHAQWGEGGRQDPAPSALELPVDPFVAGLGLDAPALALLAEAEAVYAHKEGALLTEHRLGRMLESSKLDLVAFELQVLDAPDADIARELVQCLRTDGMDVDAAASLAGLPVQHRRPFAQDLPRVVQRELLAAVPGEVLGPFTVGEVHQVVRMQRKTLPSLAMPRVRALLEDQVRRGAFGAALGERVRWLAWRPRG